MVRLTRSEWEKYFRWAIGMSDGCMGRDGFADAILAKTLADNGQSPPRGTIEHYFHEFVDRYDPGSGEIRHFLKGEPYAYDILSASPPRHLGSVLPTRLLPSC